MVKESRLKRSLLSPSSSFVTMLTLMAKVPIVPLGIVICTLLVLRSVSPVVKIV